MLVYRTWTRERRGNSMYPRRSVDYSWFEAQFGGWFLFGVIPVWVRQLTAWE